jgi:hypothetical protein
MRTLALFAPTLLGLLLPAADSRAGEREEALAIIDQAVKAHGGEAALAKLRHSVRTADGTLFTPGDAIPFSSKVTVSLPDRQRMELDVAKRQKVLTILNGDKAWRNTGGQTADLPPDLRDDLRDDLYVWYLTTLLPLKGDGFVLAPAGEVMVNDEPARTVRVSGKGRRDVILYFDKKTNLLVKAKRKATDAGLSLDKEYLFGDFKEFDGVKLPTRETQVINGKKFGEVTGASWSFPPKVEESDFERR